MLMANWLTIRQLCDEYQVDELTVKHWIKSGQLAAVNVCRRPGGTKPRWRVRREAIEAFLAARSNRPPDAQPTPRRTRQPATGRKWF